MKVELPEFKRCCGCLPLRYGLLGWSYIKLILSLPLTIFTTYVVALYFKAFLMTGYLVILPDLILQCLYLLTILLDIIFTIVFLVGGHTKNLKPLRVFYIYSIVLLCSSTFVIVALFTYDLVGLIKYIGSSPDEPNTLIGFYVRITIICIIFLIAAQAYVILLVRSEIMKLNNNHSFRFVNSANEAECALEQDTNDAEKTNIHTDEMRNVTDY